MVGFSLPLRLLPIFRASDGMGVPVVSRPMLHNDQVVSAVSAVFAVEGRCSAVGAIITDETGSRVTAAGAVPLRFCPFCQQQRLKKRIEKMTKSSQKGGKKTRGISGTWEITKRRHRCRRCSPTKGDRHRRRPTHAFVHTAPTPCALPSPETHVHRV